MLRVKNSYTGEILTLLEPDSLGFKRMFKYAMQFAIANAKACDRTWVTIEVDKQPKYYLVPTLYRVGNSSPSSASIDLIRVGHGFYGPIKWVSIPHR